jgi:hypothetical protein
VATNQLNLLRFQLEDDMGLEGEGGLFSSFFPQCNKSLPLRAKDWFKAHSSTFFMALSSSIALHILIFILLFASSFVSLNTKKGSGARAEGLFFQGIVEIKDIEPGVLDNNALASLMDVKITGSLNEKEKALLVKKLKEALIAGANEANFEDTPKEINLNEILGLLNEEGALELDSGTKIFSSKPHPGKQGFFLDVLSQEKSREIDYFKRLDELKSDYLIQANNVKVMMPSGTRYIPPSYFFKKSPYDRILAQGINLFYIVSGFPILSGIPSSIPESMDGQVNPLTVRAEHKIDVFLVDEVPIDLGPRNLNKSQSSESSKKEVVFDVNSILDEMMSYPEEKQFSIFVKRYLENYDLNDDELVFLFREFLQRNLNNIIIYISDLSAAYDFLEELYFNKPMDHQMLRFLEQHPHSEIGAEILLYFASQYDFERRALEYIFKSSEDAKKFLSKKYYRAEVYDKKTKCYILKEIHDELMKQITRLGYASPDEILSKYFYEQIKIYNFVADMGGDSRDHALFNLGQLYWNIGDHEQAMSTWERIGDSYGSKALKEIKEVIAEYDLLEQAIPRIDAILEWYSYKDKPRLLERLIRFERWKKRNNGKEAGK